MQKNSNYDRQYSLITEDNVNVGSSSDLKDFFILIAWIVFAVIIFLVSFQSLANLYINKMSVEQQLKIEKLLQPHHQKKIPEKYNKYVNTLNHIQQRIIENDTSIQFKQSFPISVEEHKEINAWIHPDGSIVFTTGILDENLSEQELAFILAHEIGHYSHKDHLKSISKQVAILILCTLTGSGNEINAVVKSISNINAIHHTKNQEKDADLYAGEMLIRMYGTNRGGIEVMKKLKDKQDYPEVLNYLSDHPLTDTRIFLLEKQENNYLKYSNK